MSVLRRYRGASALVGLVLVATLVQPAQAAPLAASASITSPTRILAGSVEHVQFSITNSAVGDMVVGRPVNYVVIRPPLVNQGLFTPSTPVDGDGPLGWTGRVSRGTVIFEAPLQHSLAPGAPAAFTVRVQAGRPDDDMHREWSVLTSDDGGNTLVAAAPAGDDALSTTVHVIAPLSVQVTSPEQVAANNAATAGQDNVIVVCQVQNAGTVAKTVTTTLTGDGVEILQAPAAANIAPQSEMDFTYRVKMGDPGSVRLFCGASAPGADGGEAATGSISVKEGAGFAYDPVSLRPGSVTPGSTQDFSLRIDKSGPVGVDLDPATTRLQIGALSVSLDEAVNIPPNDSYPVLGEQPQSVDLTFSSVSVSLPAGEYSPTLRLSGTDENGMVIDEVLAIEDTVRVAEVVIDVVPALAAFQRLQQSEAATNPTPTNLANVAFSGPVERSGEACPDCEITSATLRQFRATGTQISGANIDVSDAVENDDGQLAGSYDGEFHEDAASIELVVGVVGSQSVSNRLPVDNTPPRLLSARTGGTDGLQRDTVEVVFSEAVSGMVALPTDWVLELEPNAVHSVSLDGSRVVLTLARDLDEDATPNVMYLGCPAEAPDCPGKLADGVGLTLRNSEVVAADGILPRVPAFDSVSNMGAHSPRPFQDGKLYTNSSTPTFALSSVTGGHTLEVWHDVNANGEVNPGTDVRLCQVQATSCTSSNLGTVDKEINIIGLARDPAGNVRAGAPTPLVLDFTAPTSVSAVLDGDDITVMFSEDLVRGRNRHEDWAVSVRVDEFTDLFIVNPTGEGSTRVLELSDGRFDESVELLRVFYNHQGAAAERYEDRAGNGLANFSQNID